MNTPTQTIPPIESRPIPQPPRPPEQMIDVAKQNRDLLATIVANQEILIHQQKKKEQQQKFQFWMGVLKYFLFGIIFIWSFAQMQSILQKFLGIFQGSILGSSSGDSPLKKLNPSDLDSLFSNPALQSIGQFFQ